MYREVILDHYKNPRGHGVIEDADAEAEGFNPLCGDEVSIYVSFADDGETIDDVKFSGRGCAISQAATSMLVDMAKGRKATELAEMPKDELLEEIGIPLTPIRLKCALLGLGVSVLDHPVPARVLVVIEDHLSVHLIAHRLYERILRTLCRPSTSRSTSSATV